MYEFFVNNSLDKSLLESRIIEIDKILEQFRNHVLEVLTRSMPEKSINERFNAAFRTYDELKEEIRSGKRRE